MKVKILGTEYNIIKKKYIDDPEFGNQNIDGYCDFFAKEIVYCDMTTYPGWETVGKEIAEISEKHTLKHEIVHAFFNESGLRGSTFVVSGAWAQNEEMVDWIALQGTKIYEAWQKANAI